MLVNIEERIQIGIVTRESERALASIAQNVRSTAAKGEDQAVACLQEHDLPVEAEEALINLTAALNNQAKDFDALTKNARYLVSQMAIVLERDYQLIDQCTQQHRENARIRQEYEALDKASIWQFIWRKLKRK